MGIQMTKPSNKTMVDRLVEIHSFIHSDSVEGVFRAVDRAMYYNLNGSQFVDPYDGDEPWRSDNLHISAPCIYARVVEALDLKPGLSFLNLGSGTGYLSTVIGLLVGPNGINHGIEYHADVVEYAYKKLDKFKRSSHAIDKYDFCEPVFVVGNFLNLNPFDRRYDRIYLGAACLPEMEMFMKRLVKPDGGILVMPCKNNLMRYRRIGEDEWDSEKLMDVNFTVMINRASNDEPIINMPRANVKSLKDLCRILIRQTLRKEIDRADTKLRNSDNITSRRKRARDNQCRLANTSKTKTDVPGVSQNINNTHKRPRCTPLICPVRELRRMESAHSISTESSSSSFRLEESPGPSSDVSSKSSGNTSDTSAFPNTSASEASSDSSNSMVQSSSDDRTNDSVSEPTSDENAHCPPDLDSSTSSQSSSSTVTFSGDQAHHCCHKRSYCQLHYRLPVGQQDSADDNPNDDENDGDNSHENEASQDRPADESHRLEDNRYSSGQSSLNEGSQSRQDNENDSDTLSGSEDGYDIEQHLVVDWPSVQLRIFRPNLRNRLVELPGEFYDDQNNRHVDTDSDEGSQVEGWDLDVPPIYEAHMNFRSPQLYENANSDRSQGNNRIAVAGRRGPDRSARGYLSCLRPSSSTSNPVNRKAQSRHTTADAETQNHQLKRKRNPSSESSDGGEQSQSRSLDSADTEHMNESHPPTNRRQERDMPLPLRQSNHTASLRRRTGRRGTECETYHNQMKSSIGKLKLPRELHAYLDFDRDPSS